MGSLHEMLRDYANFRAYKEGYIWQFHEQWLDSSVRVDIFATKTNPSEGVVNFGDRIIIECVTQVQPKGVLRRLERLSKHSSRIVFCIPLEEEHKLANVKGVEVWSRSTLESPLTSIVVYLRTSLVAQVSDRASELHLKTQDVILSLIDIWLNGEVSDDSILRDYKKRIDALAVELEIKDTVKLSGSLPPSFH